jgi:hypothetical protein
MTDIFDQFDALEESYEFMLAYAAQGLPTDRGSQSGRQIRDFLERALHSISRIVTWCIDGDGPEALEPGDKYLAFRRVFERDARNALAAIELVLAQPAIGSQLVDNLNASIHLRATLTDMFLVSDILRHQLGETMPVELTAED